VEEIGIGIGVFGLVRFGPLAVMREPVVYMHSIT